VIVIEHISPAARAVDVHGCEIIRRGLFDLSRMNPNGGKNSLFRHFETDSYLPKMLAATAGESNTNSCFTHHRIKRREPANTAERLIWTIANNQRGPFHSSTR
jgi:hypothetical protein